MLVVGTDQGIDLGDLGDVLVRDAGRVSVDDYCRRAARGWELFIGDFECLQRFGTVGQELRFLVCRDFFDAWRDGLNDTG